MLTEIHERTCRRQNIMVCNAGESSWKISRNCIYHDEAHIPGLLNELVIQPNTNLKLLRIGRTGSYPWPVKIILFRTMTTACLGHKYLLQSSNIKVKVDFTLMQQNYIKNVYINCRKAGREKNITNQYCNGNPYITTSTTNTELCHYILMKF